MGGWVLVEKCENGLRFGHYREVWNDLMTKYRGIFPGVIESERFHRLFVGVGLAIMGREELTAEQRDRLSTMIALANSNLEKKGRTLAQESTAKYFKPVIIAMWISIILSAIWRLVEMLDSHS
jgi:hypothetical protein